MMFKMCNYILIGILYI